MATKKLPLLDFENKISVTVTGGKSIFKNVRDSKYLARVICCDHSSECSFFKEGKCLRKYDTVGRNQCPYGKVLSYEGYTPAARACNEWLHHFRSDEKYGALSNVGLDRHFGTMGEYYFFDTTYVSYKSRNGEEPKFDTSYSPYDCNLFIKKDELSLDWLNELFSFSPRATFGYGEIAAYKKEVVPFLLWEMSNAAPDLYKSFIDKFPKYKEVSPNFRGRRAYIATLKGGTVIRNVRDDYVLSEDRTTLTCSDSKTSLLPFGAKGATIIIPVTPEMVCEIPTNDCVLPDTKFA